jgi:hypothetical protein
MHPTCSSPRSQPEAAGRHSAPTRGLVGGFVAEASSAARPWRLWRHGDLLARQLSRVTRGFTAIATPRVTLGGHRRSTAGLRCAPLWCSALVAACGAQSPNQRVQQPASQRSSGSLAAALRAAYAALDTDCHYGLLTEDFRAPCVALSREIPSAVRRASSGDYAPDEIDSRVRNIARAAQADARRNAGDFYAGRIDLHHAEGITLGRCKVVSTTEVQRHTMRYAQGTTPATILRTATHELDYRPDEQVLMWSRPTNREVYDLESLLRPVFVREPARTRQVEHDWTIFHPPMRLTAPAALASPEFEPPYCLRMTGRQGGSADFIFRDQTSLLPLLTLWRTDDLMITRFDWGKDDTNQQPTLRSVIKVVVNQGKVAELRCRTLDDFTYGVDTADLKIAITGQVAAWDQRGLQSIPLSATVADWPPELTQHITQR